MVPPPRSAPPMGLFRYIMGLSSTGLNLTRRQPYQARRGGIRGLAKNLLRLQRVDLVHPHRSAVRLFVGLQRANLVHKHGKVNR